MQLARLATDDLAAYADLCRAAALHRENAATLANTAEQRDAHRTHAATNWAAARDADTILATR